ncbi:MAG: DUF4349 domain-containing protein [Candidatus Nanoarchaeia archaeon]
MTITNHIQTYWKNYVIGLLLVLVAFSALGMISNSMNSLSSADLSSRNEAGYAQQDMARSSYYPGGGSNAAPEEDERMIAKNANLNIESSEYHKSIREIDTLVESYSVIVMSEQESKYNDNYYRSTYNFKIESSQLDTFLNSLKELGEVQSINVYSNDVTGVVIDLQERLERYESQIQRYEEILTRNNLEIEEEINIQDRIDSLEQSIAYLQEQIQRQQEDVSYSDVYFTIQEKQSLIDELDFLGLRDGLKLFLDSLELGIRFVVSIAGFIIPIAVIYGVYRIGRRVITKK